MLADFGVALVAPEGSLTDPGTLCRYPSLCSAREQARGDTHLFDGRLDIYGLGAQLLYEMLTGHPPFKGSSRGDSEASTERTIQYIREGLYRRCRAMLKRFASDGSKKTPSRRYVTAANLAEDLERVLSRPANPPAPHVCVGTVDTVVPSSADCRDACRASLS